jgi:hypothetical protein
MKIKIISKFFLFFAAGLLFVFGMVAGVRADEISGWLWGGSEDANVGTNTGVGWISMRDSSYVVNIPQSDGELSGYAWSDNLGWVSFNTSDLSGCPGGTCSARREGSKLAGWARVLGIKTEYEKVPSNSGGWQGFIDLSGVSISGNKFSGYGWNGETAGSGSNYADGLGWISFDGAEIICVPSNVSYTCLHESVDCDLANAGKTVERKASCQSFDGCVTSSVDVSLCNNCKNETVTCTDFWKEVAP